MKQSLQDIKILLLDIEGTVCPISFVKDTLFPYALDALPRVLKTHWISLDFQPYKTAFPESAQQSPASFLAHVQDLTARDIKIAYLKNLQGYLWEEGYKTSAYSTPLFSDIKRLFNDPTSSSSSSAAAVPPQPQIAIYSSGSIFAQKLLFAHSQWPSTTTTTTKIVDLTGQIGAYFDTTTAGPKTDSGSYASIVRTLQVADPTDILFLSDNVLEIRAALEAGLRAVVVDRPGNAPLTAEDQDQLDIISSFDELKF